MSQGKHLAEPNSLERRFLLISFSGLKTACGKYSCCKWRRKPNGVMLLSTELPSTAQHHPTPSTCGDILPERFPVDHCEQMERCAQVAACSAFLLSDSSHEGTGWIRQTESPSRLSHNLSDNTRSISPQRRISGNGKLGYYEGPLENGEESLIGLFRSGLGAQPVLSDTPLPCHIRLWPKILRSKTS